jgi:sporulation protein YlmC with PRC-barrel domain
MIAAEHIEDWRGKDVVDRDGESLGKLREIYFDVPTNTPILLSIRSGLLGRHSKLIPIDGASVGPDYVRVAHAKATIERSPDADRDEPPNALELDEVGKAYDLRFADRIELETATVLEARRAEAEAARKRAEELEAEAEAKAAALADAQSRSHGASAEAEQAQREAEDARELARKARLEADRHNDAER